MIDFHYQNPKLAAIYDLDSPWSVDRDFYLSLAGAKPQNILDLGCGTGLLCDAYAEKGHDVTGADPSATMLAVARRKPHGKRIEWVQSDAQNFRSQKRFDLIIMTGHAFQTLMEDADVIAAFSTMRNHLKPDGLIVFESRNPAIDWAAQWNYDMAFETPDGTVRESRRFIAMRAGRMQFELRYQFPDEALVSQSALRFLSRQEIEAHLAASGLRPEKISGDWNDALFEEQTSHEMIFRARRF